MPSAALSEILTKQVSGRHLRGNTLASCLSSEGTLLVFLRHFGCTFCRETVAELRKVSSAANYPHVLFVHQGSVEEGDEFFAAHWPAAEAISDPERALYEAFGVGQGTINQLLGPRALVCGIKGLAKGHGIGRPIGDPLIMPGLFYLRDSKIAWKHSFTHAGDHPDFAALPTLLSAALTNRTT